MIIIVALLFALLGLFVYIMASNPKLQEIGRITYFAGILVFLWNIGKEAISILK